MPVSVSRCRPSFSVKRRCGATLCEGQGRERRHAHPAALRVGAAHGQGALIFS
jgi:hypothetical protein